MQKISFSLLLTGFIIIFNSLALSQQSERDVITLKNGSVIKGIILEQNAGSTLKIRANGHIFVLEMADVGEISKDTSSIPAEKQVYKNNILEEDDTIFLTLDKKEPLLFVTLFGGLAAPFGGLSAAGGQFGYNLGGEAAYTIEPDVKIVFCADWSINGLGGSSNFSNLWLLTGVKYEEPIGENLQFYGLGQIGVAGCMEFIEIDDYTEAQDEDVAFACGVGAGIIINRFVNMGLRFSYAQPELSRGTISVASLRFLFGIQI